MTVRKLTAEVEAVRAVVPGPGEVDRQADPLLAAIEDARARMTAAGKEIRLLLAYGRRFVYPHPYTLGELAASSGMSVSGVRTAFDADDVRRVSRATGLEPTPADGEGS